MSDGSNARVTPLAVASIVLSFVTMTYAGLMATPAYRTWLAVAELPGVPQPATIELLQFSAVWGPAVGFAVALMSILMAHEMGHFLTAKRLGIDVTFPLFIPFVPPLGSLGAVMGMTLDEMPASSLNRIAAYGPFAGLVVAIPVCVLGLSMSEIQPLVEGGWQLGDSLLFSALEWLVVGTVPAGQTVMLHPVALAGWAGIMITGFNLLPFGQLDGGHLAFGLWGDAFNRHVGWVFAVWATVFVLIYPPFLFIALLLWLGMGLQHEELTTDGVVTGRDRWIGHLGMLLFVLTFTPRPQIITWPELIASLPFFS